MKHVRLKLAWQTWPKGYVFTAMPAAQAQVMVERGMAEYCDEEIKFAPVDRMMRAARLRGAKVKRDVTDA